MITEIVNGEIQAQHNPDLIRKAFLFDETSSCQGGLRRQSLRKAQSFKNGSEPPMEESLNFDISKHPSWLITRYSRL